ncbi:hypothetical protein ASPZODRAFT_136083 [Penicilliopsis zonata CBS 506.65]|uniref:BTB domain-containing protein n=1 Tax=Penicilliopsis zonata CBS 506.65 TaxID=1073090 RepID=A0A1L9S920_9EURO|nr:hypothetical protein ASPZODRAFT_136083 [Penicilliopsis zonata CBS 506.65]OJJ43629.1 hypothetical protein ASPZODRAFT_136083 [Penicilliopsis zonata CBS 506.65]
MKGKHEKRCRKGHMHTVKLSDCNPTAVGIYLHWLCSGKFAIEVENAPDSVAYYHHLSEACLLGDRLLDTRYVNAAIDAIVDLSDQISSWDWPVPGDSTVEFVSKQTPVSSPFRRLMVDMFACYGSADL